MTPVEVGGAAIGAVAITWTAQTLRMAIPYVCAGLGGVWSERSGVVNIALEGVLLAAGLGAVIAHLAIGSAFAGVVAGCLVGAALGALHTAIVVQGRVDAIVSGLAINMLAAGGTRFALRSLYASSSNSPAIAGFPPLVRGATGGALLARTLFDPMTLLTCALVAGSAWALARTRFGLRVRASGEIPRRPRAPGSTCAGSACSRESWAARLRESGAWPSRTTSTDSSRE